jgi:hypothetical protein
MTKLKYYFRRLKNMNHGAMITYAKYCAKERRVLTVFILLDMVCCSIKYGAGSSEYTLFRFHLLNSKQRATMFTGSRNVAFAHRYNERPAAKRVDNKITFSELYGKFLGRSWLNAETATIAEVEAFLAAHPVFFAKPPDGLCGKGIKAVTAEGKTAQSLLDELKAEQCTLWDEPIIQHDTLNAIYPGAVNTVRVMSFLDDSGNVRIIGAVLRIGNGAYVDNFASGGLAAVVDLETGKLSRLAQSKSGETYDKHPLTGAVFGNITIPYWEAVHELVYEAALIEPKVRYVGWDVAITAEKPVLIECNPLPDYGLLQLPAHTETGIIPRLKSFGAKIG